MRHLMWRLIIETDFSECAGGAVAREKSVVDVKRTIFSFHTKVNDFSEVFCVYAWY